MLKRSFDVVFSMVGLILLIPILLLVGPFIKEEDGGPIFYRGVRVGRYRKPFKIFKFRIMVLNAGKLGAFSTADDDSRVSKVGRYHRKYKLDEMPQLINVLKGR